MNSFEKSNKNCGGENSKISKKKGKNHRKNNQQIEQTQQQQQHQPQTNKIIKEHSINGSDVDVTTHENKFDKNLHNKENGTMPENSRNLLNGKSDELINKNPKNHLNGDVDVDVDDNDDNDNDNDNDNDDRNSKHINNISSSSSKTSKKLNKKSKRKSINYNDTDDKIKSTDVKYTADHNDDVNHILDNVDNTKNIVNDLIDDHHKASNSNLCDSNNYCQNISKNNDIIGNNHHHENLNSNCNECNLNNLPNLSAQLTLSSPKQSNDELTNGIDLSNVVIEYKEYESELQMQDIMRLIQAELSEPYSIYTYRYFIYNWPKLCFLASHGNEYVGAIVCKLDMHMHVVKRGYIAMLAVKKEYRKLKIGTNLVQKAIEAMLADDADEVVLETEMKNVPALRLYENLGFVRDKRLFRYYLNGVDALRLKLWFR